MADTPVDRKEVACPAVVHNTAFIVVIKGFKPLDNGRAKSERNKCFLYKRPVQCVKRFLKVKEKYKSRNIFSSGVINNAVN